jgi:hypothetical protein
LHLACITAALLLPSTVFAANPSKLYPGFAAQRDSLGEAVLLVDVVEIEDVIGKVEKVYVDDCKELSQKMMTPLLAALVKAGYHVDQGRTASVGQGLDSTLAFKILGNWKEHHWVSTDQAEKKPFSTASHSQRKAAEARAAADTFPVGAPPFYVDSLLARDSLAGATWADACRGLWAYQRKKASEPGLTLAARPLREALGADWAFIMLARNRRVPAGKSFGAGLLSAVTQVGGSSGGFSFSGGLGVEQGEGTSYRIAVVDLRSGELLWMDEESNESGIRGSNFKALADYFVRRMSR